MQNFSRLWTAESGFLGSLFRSGGYEVRIVGGAVRDCLKGISPKDIDLASDATPEEMIVLAAREGLRIVESGLKHGTVSFIINREMIEVTTLRQDLITDGRHATVAFIRDFELDAARRDFTINALSVDTEGVLHDYFGGAEDLKAGIVRFVGDPGERIREDYLRILRYFRFRGRFAVADASGSRTVPADDSAMDAVRVNREGLKRISGERIWQEMSRIIADPGGFAELPFMEKTGVAAAIGLPGGPDLQLAGTAAASGAEPAVILGFLLSGSPVTPEALRERWKFGTEETLLARAAWEMAPLADAPFGDFLDMALLPNSRRDRISAVLTGMDRLADADRIAGTLPEFPVQGRDIVASGIAPGPAVGQAMAEMRAAWKDSGYVATRADLMAGLTGMKEPRL